MAITKAHSWSYSHTGHVLTWAAPIHVSISRSLWTCILATCLCYSVYCILSQIQEFPRPKQCYLLESIYLPGVGVAVVPKIFKTPFNWVFKNDWSFILTVRHIMFMAKHLKNDTWRKGKPSRNAFYTGKLVFAHMYMRTRKGTSQSPRKMEFPRTSETPTGRQSFSHFLISSFSPIFPYLTCYFL